MTVEGGLSDVGRHGKDPRELNADEEISVTRRQPDVSVIIPVYNAASWLEQCLLSVLRQSQVTTQIICVNDGSTDDSLLILRQIQTANPNRIEVIDQPNGGASLARNAGLEVAAGRYVCMLDSDDFWQSDALASLVARADGAALDVLQFDAVPFRDGGVDNDQWERYARYYARPGQPSETLRGPELLATQARSSSYRPSAVLYLLRRGLLGEHHISFVPNILHEDNPFTFAVMLNARRAAHVALDFYARRLRPGSIMTAGSFEKSMRGYFVSYLRMQEELARQQFDSDISIELGGVISRVLNNVLINMVRVDDSAVRRLAELVSSEEAERAYSELVEARNRRKAPESEPG